MRGSFSSSLISSEILGRCFAMQVTSKRPSPPTPLALLAAISWAGFVGLQFPGSVLRRWALLVSLSKLIPLSPHIPTECPTATCPPDWSFLMPPLHFLVPVVPLQHYCMC